MGLTGLMLCAPLGASAQVGTIESPQLPQVTVPPVTVPPVVPQSQPPALPPVPQLAAPRPLAPTPPPSAPPPALPTLSGSATASAGAGDLAAIVERAVEAAWPPGAVGGANDDRSARDRRASRAERRAKRARERQVRRRLRRIVERHSECHFVLTGRERRVLRLHLGLGEHEPRSRLAVARRLETSSRRVRRLERRAIQKLRRADRSGICEQAAVTLVSGSVGAGGVPAVFADSADAPQESGSVLGARRSGGSRGDRANATNGDTDGAAVGPFSLADGESGMVTLAWIVATATALTLLAGVLQLWRRGVLELPEWLRRTGGSGR
jgi:hypothetical protein